MRNPLHAHDIGTRIRTLNQRLDDICKRGSSFSFVKLEAYEKRKTTRPLTTNRKTDSLIERSGTVGDKIEQDMRELVEVLTKESASDKGDSLMVVAVVGLGGIGKTTLSKKIFNDEAMEGKFNRKIWLSITQDFSDVELLSKAIIAAGEDLPRGGGARDKDLLVVTLKNAIKDKNFFLVLDDMWGVDEWDKLLMTPFSYGSPGSRVLITTRHETVARSMKAIHYHHIEKLSPEDAWSLLKKEVLSTEKNQHELDMLKDVGLQIIAKCDGLPLAVKVMGGLLCKKEKTRCDWEDVLNNDIWSVSRMPEQLNYAIYLSYEDLAPSLKQCFLYFSLKPKKLGLTINQVVSMWIGEGLVHGDSCNLEEQGTRNYKELISRNLIEPDTDYPGLLVCSMHDVIRSFAQYVSKEEAQPAHVGDTVKNKLISEKIIRLSIETKGFEPDEFEWRYLKEQKSLRTLILYGNFKIQPSDSLITLSSLRNLIIESANFARLVESVCQLKHLRYLSLRSCSGISTLPANIHKLKFLQYIDLEDCEGFVKLPDSIVKLQELRYLDIYRTLVNSIPKGFGALTNWRALYGFPAYMDGDWCSLEELVPLSQVKELGLKGLENVSATSSIENARVCSKAHLNILTLECVSKLGDDGFLQGGVPEEQERKIEEVFNVLCPMPCLEYLSIKGYFGRQLPRWMMWTAREPLQNLRTLFLNDLPCCTQLPDGMGQLPCLEILKVSHSPAIERVGTEFVQHHNHHNQASSQAVVAFPRLHKMHLTGMVQWKEWEWEDGAQAMPALEELLIESCKLRSIPPSLASHARSLKKLTIWSVKGLQYIENFVSVVELKLWQIPCLTRISNFPKLQRLGIAQCPKLESLPEMNALRTLLLIVSYKTKQLPLYLKTTNPRRLRLKCSPELLSSMAAGKSGSEWETFSHIQHVEAYVDDGGIEKKWHLYYTREPCSMETNMHLMHGPDSEDVLSGLAGLFRSGDER